MRKDSNTTMHGKGFLDQFHLLSSYHRSSLHSTIPPHPSAVYLNERMLAVANSQGEGAPRPLVVIDVRSPSFRHARTPSHTRPR